VKLRRAVWPVLVTVVLVGVLFVAVFPTRAWVSQQRSIGDAEEQLDVLEEQNGLLEERIASLHDDEEIERLAREQYNLVRPGEEAYAVLPPAPTDTPATIPADGDDETGAEDDSSLVEQVVDFVVFW
jgi:cell division protein FtsB